MPHNTTSGIDERICRQFRFCPDSSSPVHRRILIDSSTDVSFLSYLSCLAEATQLPVRVSPTELEQHITAHFGKSVPSDAKAPVQISDQQVSETGVVKDINDLIRDCIEAGASDIHFEPGERQLVCRARLDGMLVQKKLLGKDQVPELLSRLKIMSGLDIAEKRRPQDGRIRFSVGTRSVDIRVSIIPTDFGEKAVLRILDKEKLRLDLAGLGFRPKQLKLFSEKIAQPNGIILVTGPTGSGKTTTLYAALNQLRSPNTNISTVEDPIEYYIEGVNQTQVKPEIDLTFSAMLRALLRQDPNIIMVGEIRDQETLDIAIRASLTGHLVLSTVHTNSAVATITRLLDMGAEPYLIASSLRLIVAQRLLRLNCPNCSSSTLTDENRAATLRLGLRLSESSRQGTGCDTCHQTGYSGRVAVYELLPIDEELKGAITAGQSEGELARKAAGSGFESMLQSAQTLIDQGKTTPLEVLRELSL
jgi:type II secretory ATPase GspE/PulE/Tfp pilus assembly ATPase PilB-like protein